MKSIKLTNLERMQEQEMQQIKGGSFPYLIRRRAINGDACWCLGSCSGDAGGGRSQQGINDSKMSSH